MENSFYLFSNLDLFRYEISMHFIHKVKNSENMFLLYFVSCSVVLLPLHNYVIKVFKQKRFPALKFPKQGQAILLSEGIGFRK
jgi:hypothetical protein